MGIRNSTRRQVLRWSGTACLVGVAGCSQFGGDESEISDTDGDGVIDSEDYAPRDPEVQRKAQVVGDTTMVDAPADTPTTATGTSTETPAAEVPPVLTQALPDPEEYVGGGSRAGYDRATGEVRIDTGAGSFALHGPGQRAITLVGGYLAAEELRPADSWGQVVEDDTKLVGTNATFGFDELAFTPGSFRGVALRANRAIDLYVDDRQVVEGASLVRYETSRGVFERSMA